MSPRIAAFLNEFSKVGGKLSLLCLLAAGFALPRPPQSGPQATPIHDTVTALQSVKPPPDERELPDDVPEAARPLLKQLKHQLRDLIAATLNDQHVDTDKPERLAAEVKKRLMSLGVRVGEKGIPDAQFFGGIYDINIRRPAGHPELLAATTDLQIPCGNDSSLYFFRRDSTKWKLVLALEANDYPQINGAQGNFDFGVSPIDAHGSWFLVAANLHPWCTSNWNAINYRVVQPGTDPYSPRVLFRGSIDMVNRGVEGDPYKLLVEAGSFQFSYVGYMPLDLGIVERSHINRYQITSGSLIRVAPLADFPEDFLDEWIDLSWTEAARWCDSLNKAALERWHARLSRSYDWKNSDPYSYLSNLDFSQPCSKPPKEWQIGLSIDSEKRVDRLPERLFFTVTKRGEAFYLQHIDTVRPPGCPGEAQPHGRLP